MWCIHIVVWTWPLRIILSVWSDFHMTDSLSIAVHVFASHVLISCLIDEVLLPRLVNLSTSFSEAPFSMEILSFWLKRIFFILSAFTWRPMSPDAHSRLCSRDLVWVGVFAKSEALCHQYSLHPYVTLYELLPLYIYIYIYINSYMFIVLSIYYTSMCIWNQSIYIFIEKQSNPKWRI